MSKFIKSGSRWFIVTGFFFIVALFIDQSNLPDIIVGNNSSIDIEHPEEVETSLSNSSFNVDNSLGLKTIIKQSSNVQFKSKRILVDEDSASNEIIKIDIATLNETFNKDNPVIYIFVPIKASIYLQNESLLI